MKSPVKVELIKEKRFMEVVKEYLGCASYSEINCAYERYPVIFESLVLFIVKTVLANHYININNKIDTEDIPITTYRFLFSSDGKMASVPLSGAFFLQTKKGDKIVLYPKLYDLSGYINITVYFKVNDKECASDLFVHLKEELWKVKDQKFTGSGRFLKLKKEYKWDDIILPENIKNLLKSNVVDFINKRQYFEKRNVIFKRGLLFHSKPGLGKTFAGLVLASQVKNCNFVYVTPKDIEYRPTTAISNIYLFARMLAPTIVFFEDLDLMGGNDRYSPFHREILGELLNQLDGFEANNGVVTIATTNKPEALDEALGNRPGRFDVKIEFKNPDFPSRLALLEKLASNSKLKLECDLKEIAEMTEGLSYAQISEIFTRSQIASLEEQTSESADVHITAKHLIEAARQLGVQNNNKSLGFITKAGDVL